MPLSGTRSSTPSSWGPACSHTATPPVPLPLCPRWPPSRWTRSPLHRTWRPLSPTSFSLVQVSSAHCSDSCSPASTPTLVHKTLFRVKCLQIEQLNSCIKYKSTEFSVRGLVEFTLIVSFWLEVLVRSIQASLQHFQCRMSYRKPIRSFCYQRTHGYDAATLLPINRTLSFIRRRCVGSALFLLYAVGFHCIFCLCFF